MAAIANKRELKKGPWTAEEDSVLLNYINIHGERNWNTVAHCAGLRRNGKSCRLRWLNYLRPDVRRGNITLQEQLLILQLHSLWGNRWSKIAQHLPGRTDNEIKNYWRTRVQKQAKQLNCDVNSQQFRDAMRHEYIPRLMERINTEPLLIAPSSPFTTTHRHLQVLPPRDFMPEITSGASSDSLDNQTSADYYNLLGEENKSCSDSWLDGRSNSLLELEKCFLTDDCIGPTWFV